MRSAGRPSRSSAPSGISHDFSSARTFCPNRVSSTARRSTTAFIRARSASPSAAPDRTNRRCHKVSTRCCSGVRPNRAWSATTAFTRAKSSAFVRISASWAASLGLIVRCSASSASLVSAPVRLKKTPQTLSKSADERSSASMVFAKVGASGLSTIDAIPARSAARAASKAGSKSSMEISANGGSPKGVVQVSRRGFMVLPSSLALSRQEWSGRQLTVKRRRAAPEQSLAQRPEQPHDSTRRLSASRRRYCCRRADMSRYPAQRRTRCRQPPAFRRD